jgi:hypothetical protein
LEASQNWEMVIATTPPTANRISPRAETAVPRAIIRTDRTSGTDGVSSPAAYMSAMTRIGVLALSICKNETDRLTYARLPK